MNDPGAKTFEGEREEVLIWQLWMEISRMFHESEEALGYDVVLPGHGIIEAIASAEVREESGEIRFFLSPWSVQVVAEAWPYIYPRLSRESRREYRNARFYPRDEYQAGGEWHDEYVAWLDEGIRLHDRDGDLDRLEDRRAHFGLIPPSKVRERGETG